MAEHATPSQSFGPIEAHNGLFGNQFSGHTNITFQGHLDNTQRLEDEKKRREKEKEACLRSLAFREINARRHDIVPAHPDTCDWLFDTLEFRQWMDPVYLQVHNGVFWIKGKPGVGKSTLMEHVFHHFKKLNSSDYLLIAYFFNARGETLEKTPLGMLRSIAFQLLQTDDAMYTHFQSYYVTASQETHWQWRQSELQEFIRWAVTQPLSRPFILLVDALDECSVSDVRDVVGFLESLSVCASRAQTRLKICLSSRHYPSITIGKVVGLTVEKSPNHDTDISKYINERLTVSDAEIEAEIRERANGIFLWVVIVVSLLNKAYDEGQVEAMQRTLEEVPADLEEMFSAILRKDVSNASETVRMFQWVLLSVRPLTPQELFVAAVGPAPPARDLIQRRITNSSKGLIEIRKAKTDSVQFIHLSVRDFLSRYKRLQILDATLGPEPFTTIHGRLWARCWSGIQEAGITSPSQELIILARSKDPFLVYSAVYILKHADRGLSNGATIRRGDEWLGREKCPSDDSWRTHIKDWLRESDRWFPWWILFVTTCSSAECPYETGLQPGEKAGVSLIYMLAVLRLPNLIRALPEGTDINKQGGLYGNALQAASSSGLLEIVELLLGMGADVNAQGGEYGNALQAASQRGRLDIVKLFLEKGADVNAQGGEYGNALQAALCGEHLVIAKLLLDNGADFNAQGGKYGNALQAALFSGHLDIAELLLGNGVDVNAQGGYYGSALQVASIRGGPKMLELLLDNGADVNAQGGIYGNALEAALNGGSMENAKLLIKKGAHVNTQDSHLSKELQATLYALGRDSGET
ncbi:hypothetical protein LZ30DRAFT_651621 [Colletotrichum cereale]|nr:hypothetical protein LZ30DRAFT_651621 [Colletotrichum cereale]